MMCDPIRPNIKQFKGDEYLVQSLQWVADCVKDGYAVALLVAGGTGTVSLYPKEVQVKCGFFDGSVSGSNTGESSRP